jgi:hypothetical protein
MMQQPSIPLVLYTLTAIPVVTAEKHDRYHRINRYDAIAHRGRLVQSMTLSWMERLGSTLSTTGDCDRRQI